MVARTIVVFPPLQEEPVIPPPEEDELELLELELLELDDELLPEVLPKSM
jgi:hypothetical protein